MPLKPILSPTPPLSKAAREVRAKILAVLESLPVPTDLAEYCSWWEQLYGPAVKWIQIAAASLSSMAPPDIQCLQ